MKSNKTNSNNNMKDDLIEIDLKALLKTVWSKKKIITRIILISFIVGCIYAIASPVIYESKTAFVPQTSDQSSLANKGIGSLASLAGINLNSRTSSSLDKYISPLLYSKIIESDEFSDMLINEELIFLNGDKLTVKDYLLLDSENFNFIGFIKENTIGLFSKEKKKEVVDEQILMDYNFIDEVNYSAIQTFKKKFSIELNEKEGYIEVIATDKNAFISTQLVTLVTKNLQSRIISLRTNKIKEQLEYSKEQYEQKKEEFEVLQNNLAEFKDSNKNISTAVFLAELQKLESEYQLQENILISLASEYNENKIKLNKNTPIFSVLDEVSVPNERSKPKRKLIVLIFVIIGLIISISYIIIRDPIIELFKFLNEKN